MEYPERNILQEGTTLVIHHGRVVYNTWMLCRVLVHRSCDLWAIINMHAVQRRQQRSAQYATEEHCMYDQVFLHHSRDTSNPLTLQFLYVLVDPGIHPVHVG